LTNKYTGEVSLDICGEKCVLVYDWSAVSRIHSEYAGGDVLKNLRTQPPDVIANLLAIGLEKNNPAMTKDRLMSLSPPLVPMIAAIDKAVSVSYFGADGVREIEKVTDNIKKKTR
jgi:hypothetical protein